MFERKHISLNSFRQITSNSVDGDSAVRVVVIGLDPGTIRLGIVHFGLIDRDEVSTVGRGVLVTPLDSGHGIYLVPLAFFVSAATGAGAGGEVGASGVPSS